MDFNSRHKACSDALVNAAQWLAFTAQMRGDEAFDNPENYPHADFTGAVRTDYDTRSKRWSVNGPIFHTGQTIRSLLVAERRTGDHRYHQSAIAGGEFLIRERISDPAHPQAGLLLSLEQNDDEVNIQVTFESLSGLIDLHDHTGEARYLDVVRENADILLRGAWLPDERLMLDHYSLGRREFFRDPDNNQAGRAMVDDAVLLKLAQRTGDSRYQDRFIDMAGRLLEVESPPNTWLSFPPWKPSVGRVHNRKNWWWGWPLLAAYDATGEERFLQGAIRAADWYRLNQNLDGGLYYTPGPDGRHSSFGLCTSVVACAIIFWSDLWKRTQREEYLDAIGRGVGFLLAAQFRTDVEDDNVRGAFWEAPFKPDGSLNPGWQVRDLGAIFGIRALDAVLDIPELLDIDSTWADTSMKW